MKTMTFNELRRIKDKLPDGSMKIIADNLSINVESVKNYFGAQNYKVGEVIGIHTEQGPDGGIVLLDDTTILEEAYKILKQNNLN